MKVIVAKVIPFLLNINFVCQLVQAVDANCLPRSKNHILSVDAHQH